MTENEFSRYMTGELTAESSGYTLGSGYSCEGLRLLYHDLTILTDLEQKNDELKTEREQLHKDIKVWTESLSSQVESILARTPIVIRPPKIKSIDDENPSVEGLASPLIPSVVPGGGHVPAEWNSISDSSNGPILFSVTSKEFFPKNDMSLLETTESTSVPNLNSASVTDSTNPKSDPKLSDVASPLCLAAASALRPTESSIPDFFQADGPETPFCTGSPAIGPLRSKQHSYDSLDLLEANFDSDDDLLNVVDESDLTDAAEKN